jgi:hypothetical protein
VLLLSLARGTDDINIPLGHAFTVLSGRFKLMVEEFPGAGDSMKAGGTVNSGSDEVVAMMFAS